MLRKWNRPLAYLLALALIATTFHSDFASIRVYADGEETVEESTNSSSVEETAAEPVSEEESNNEDPAPSDPEPANEEPAPNQDPSNPEEPAPGNEDPAPADQGQNPADPATPPAEQSDEASAGITDPANIPSDGEGGDENKKTDEENDDASALGSSELADDAAALGSSDVADDAAALGSSEEEEEEEEELEEKLVTVKYSAQLGGRVSKSSETIDINDKTAKLEGSTATAVNKYYQFMAWVDESGNTVSTESSFVPSDVKEDCSFTATFEKLSNMPAQDFSGSAGGMNVSVVADEGIFPEGTTMVVSAISDDEALAAATDALGESVSTAKGVDITFRNADGDEIEPADSKYVHVTMTLASALEGEEFKVVHKDDNGNASEIAGASASGADFDANSFSVYILAGIDDETNRKVATYRFKVYNFDTKEWNIVNEQFLYDGETLANPGIPTTGANQTFRGWFREDNGAQINDFGPITVSETIEIPVKAKIDITYHVDLIGVSGEVIQVLEATVENDETAQVTINETVQVKEAEQAFIGWKNQAGTVYPVGSTIDATDANNKRLTAEIVQAYWINFNENDGGTGGGASYTAPIYVTAETNYKATEPAHPTRSGYDFKGWYLDAAGTQAFNWNTRITSNITLYAKWQKGKGSFTIVIWKQKVTDSISANPKTYDYEDSRVVSDYNVDASITRTMLGDAITQKYPGFTYGSNDSAGKTINAKGTTVVNVYYNRNVITFNFYIRQGRVDQLNQTMQGLYESTLAANNYTWPVEREWHEGSYSGIRTTFLDAFLYDDKTTVNFYSQNKTSGSYQYYHYKQNIDGRTYPETATNTAVKDYEKKFDFSNKYTGFTVCGYIDDEYPEMRTVGPDSSEYVYGNTYIYHKRNEYKFSLVQLKEGIDAATGQPVETTEIKVADYKLLYEAPISGKQTEVLAAANALSAPDGYKLKVVDGNFIFADAAGTTPVNWSTTMPASDDTRVYVIWTKERFRALLDENWDGDKNRDTKLGTETAPLNNQSTDFKPWYGATIERDAIMNNFVRPGYEIVGWFNVADDTPYDYAKVTADVNIYAKWRRTGTVNIVYDANGGTLDSAYLDTHDYAGDSAVVVTAPPTAPDKKVFAGWELLDKDGNPVAIYYPNGTFQITDALIVSDGENKGHVTLRAKYDDAGIIDDSIYTTITYDPNGGSGSRVTISTTGEDNHRLRAKEAVKAWTEAEAKAAFTRSGYELIGWNTDKGRADAQQVSIGFGAEYIVADNANNPYNSDANILYAVWKPVVQVVVTIVGNHDSKPYNKTEQFVYDYQITNIEYKVNGQPIQMSGFSADDVKLVEGVVAVASGTNAGHYPMGLSSSSFVSTNADFQDVVFNVTDGYLDITALTVVVKVTGNNDAMVYDGAEHSVTGYTLATGGVISEDDITYTGTAEANRTDVGTSYMGIDVSKFSYHGDSNYIVSFERVADGYIWIKPAKISVKIIGNNDTKVYDGIEHSITGYRLDAGTYAYTEADFTFSGTAEAKRTAEGTTNMNLQSSQFTNTNTNYSEVTFEITDGYMTITPIDKVVVTIVGNSETHDYDGEKHTVTGYKVVNISNDLYTEADFTFSGTASVEGQDAGTYDMGLSSDNFTNNSSNFSKVEFNVTDGHLIINPISVTVKIYGNSSTESYTGSEHVVTGYRVGEISPTLYTEADFTFKGDATANGTDVGTYRMSISASDFENTNKNFDSVTFIVTPGELTITPIDFTVNITGNNSTVDYDGEEHVITGYTTDLTEDSLLKESDIVFSGTASAAQTDVGTKYMGLDPSQFSVNNSNFATVTFNIAQDGYQTVDPITVTVTIVGNSGSFNYDGTEHTVSGYEVTDISNGLYVEADFEFKGTASVSGTDAGTYPMGLASDQFENHNNNFSGVIFEVTDGSLEINKIKNVVVTITGNTASFPYTGIERSVTGYTVETNNSLYKEDFIKFTGTAKASGTNVAEYPMGLTVANFANNNANFENVKFIVEDGKLTITPIKAEVNIFGHTDRKTYDGNDHEVTGYEVQIVTPLYSRADFAFDGTAAANRTEVGTTYMLLTEDLFRNVSDNFSEVKFNVTDGYIEILPKDKVKVTITGNSDVVDYTGSEQKVEGYTVQTSDPLYTEADFTFKGEAIAKGTDADTYYMNLTEAMFKDTSGKFSEVEFDVIPGYIIINPISITVNITGNYDTLIYNGSEQKVEGFTATSEYEKFDATKVVYDGQPVAAGTNVGTYDMNLNVEKFSYDDPNYADVVFVIDADGFLIIDPEEVVVTITGKEDTLEYNGREQEITGYTVSAGNPLYDITKVSMTGEAKAKGKRVGDYKMNLKEEQFKNNDDNFVVNFIVNDGILHIIGREDKFVITATTTSTNREYSGEVYSGFGYNLYGGKSVSQEGNAIANIVEFITGVLSPIKASAADGSTNDTVTIDGVTYKVTGLHVDTAEREVGTYLLRIDGDMKVTDEDGEDVTDQFELNKDEGYLTIDKRVMVITSGSATKVYDGLPLTEGTITLNKPWATGDVVNITVTGTITDVGSTPNTFTLHPMEGTDLEKNYLITTVFGTLVVTDEPTGGPTPPPTDPVPPTTIVDTPAPLAPAPIVDAAVLGATRQSGAAVLGARRAKTEDETNTLPRVFAMMVAALVMLALLATFRKKEEEEQ